MFVRTTTSKNSPRKSVKVVESVREGYKVKQVMLLHVGIASTEADVEKLTQIAKEFIAEETQRREKNTGQTSIFPPKTSQEYLAELEQRVSQKNRGRKKNITLENVAKDDLLSLSDLVEEKRVIEGIHDVAGHVYDQFGYQHLLKKMKDKMLLKDLVLMRLAEPSSKLKSQKILEKRFSKMHDMDAIYRVMDKLYPSIEAMQRMTFNRTQKLMPETIDLLFFDCTTLYFESTNTDELRKFGYSKDHRFNTTQVVLALATNSDGLPIGYELFEGNKAEVSTLMVCLERWKTTFNIQSVCFVADRAMMSDENLNQLEAAGYSYVVAAKLRTLPKQLQSKFFVEENCTPQATNDGLGWIGEFEYKARRLIVSYKADRAKRDANQRAQIVEKIEKRLGKKEGNTERLMNNHGVKKYTRTENAITKIDEEKIAEDAQWDGLHGVITNLRNAEAQEVLARYNRLWKIEESFRINKHTLSMRPIYHFKTERIRAHIALCFMAFSVLRHMEYRVKLAQKISVDDMLDELMHVEASFYRHTETNRLYRMPGKFTHCAAKIYKTFQLKRNNHAQVLTSH